eukprot:1210356-Heterocapsa_arctica.AAC.1
MRKRITKATTPGAGGPWGAAGGGAVVFFVVRFRLALAGHVPRAHMACRCDGVSLRPLIWHAAI